MDIRQMFPDERGKPTTRLKQCHAVLFRMFRIFDFLCKKHNIEYFLCSGTLKAAVLYKGFKPWDDDFDVGMTRENFEKFEQYAVPELPDDIFFQTPETDAFYPACHVVEAKLRDKYSSYVQGDTLVKWHNGLMLDLLVFDRAFLPHNIFIFLQNRVLRVFLKHKGNKARARVLKWIAEHTPFQLVYASSYISVLKTLMRGNNYFREKEISDLVKTQFEDMEVSIPKGWDSYLKRRYGNYKQVPPPEQQNGHHGIDIPAPFTPCSHSKVLLWKEEDKQGAQISK
ncbi:LicD family protein [Pontibacter mangrovi]|uniref:LicD family protein n=1 Tax=Pontibacter mangrovi TaxID=2589816 RepID=A0A501W6R7_9BACT|nr:LicD family protein [Pontibacter mangrovi]TPE42981.1 LicD family protein [Pontibacter mangrovi]